MTQTDGIVLIAVVLIVAANVAWAKITWKTARLNKSAAPATTSPRGIHRQGRLGRHTRPSAINGTRHGDR